MTSAPSGRHRVPYLHERQIEREAEFLLGEWAAKGKTVAVPVPLDDLVELHLELSLEVEDLRTRLKMRDVLGAIWFDEDIIRIDTTLDPRHRPSMLGRFNFTLAHEIGHWRLHRPHLRGNPEEAMLFGASAPPAFVCRDGDPSREEWQADAFAGCLLMPRTMLRDAWSEWRQSDDPVALTDLHVRSVHASRKLNEHLAMEQFCRPLADRFAVSAPAMRIRLQALGLLVEHLEPRLF